MQWHIITGEFPPQRGGMSDYSFLVARELSAAGDEVHVWCPAAAGPAAAPAGVTVHRELGSLGRADLRRCGALLDAYPGPRQLLVQWTPHAFGRRSLNVPFCWWLLRRARGAGDRVGVMVHEACLPLPAGSARQNAAALVHRLMMLLLVRAAERIWVSIPAWEERFRPLRFAGRAELSWLPVPSNVPVVDDAQAVGALRSRVRPAGGVVLGHFGTYGREVGGLLLDLVPDLLRRVPGGVLLLMGRGSEAFRDRLTAAAPGLAGRIHATGGLPPEQLSVALSACDLMVQPYIDGVSTRRGSFMAALAHARPIVTTSGELTEPLWRESGAVALAPAGDPEALGALVQALAADHAERARLQRAAASLYAKRFALRHSVAAYREFGLGGARGAAPDPTRSLEEAVGG